MGNQPGQEGYTAPEDVKGKKGKRPIKAEPPSAQAQANNSPKPQQGIPQNAPPNVHRPAPSIPNQPPADLLSTPVSVYPVQNQPNVLKPQASDSPFLNPITPAKPQQNYFVDLDKATHPPSALSPISNQPGLKLGPQPVNAQGNPSASPITKLGQPAQPQAPLNIHPNQLGAAPKPPIDPNPPKPIIVEAPKPAPVQPSPIQNKPIEPVKQVQNPTPNQNPNPPKQSAAPTSTQQSQVVPKPIQNPSSSVAKPGTTQTNPPGSNPTQTAAKPTQNQQPAPANKSPEKLLIKSEPIESQLIAIPMYSASPVHLNITGMETVVLESIVEVRVPKLQAEYWLLYIPVPPLTSFQYGSKVWVQIQSLGAQPQPFTAAGVDDQGRELIQLTLPVSDHPQFSQGLALSVFFEVNLVARELFFDPSVQLQAQAASQHELMICSSDLGRYHLTDQNFQQFIHAHGDLLYRNPQEIADQTIIYAQRVFHFLSEHFTVVPSADSDRNLHNIIRNKKSDAAGLSLLFCAILRCQEVPARLLVGRWVKDDPAPYTIAEFYVDQVGWIPADIASMISFGKNKPKNAQGRLPYFGEQPTNFVALHYDFDISVDTIKYGIQTLASMQTLPFWVSGTGTEDNKQSATKWKVVSRVNHSAH